MSLEAHLDAVTMVSLTLVGILAAFFLYFLVIIAWTYLSTRKESHLS